jgi:acetyl-CoA acetyltransferase
MNDIAIIGVRLHPFGRFEGKSAMQMGVDAIFAAFEKAGVASASASIDPRFRYTCWGTRLDRPQWQCIW